MFAAALTGYATALSLILAIGAQNAFVLRQGLMRQHVLPLCLFCALSDAVLISAGVAGFGALVTLYPVLPKLMALAGATFLLVYGSVRLREAMRGEYSIVINGKVSSLRGVLLTAAAITWLNPHVYLDTLALIGAVSTQYTVTEQKVAFAAAAILASFSFFFALGYGARALTPVMQSTLAWQLLDTVISVVMWVIATGLILSVL